MRNEIETAIIVVDVQNDFCPGGSLAVPDGDKIIEHLNEVSEAVRETDRLVVFTRDWHPKKTTHFKEFGGIWPEHCVQETEGAAFHKDLVIKEADVVVSKGMGEDEDAYSAFDARDKDNRLLEKILKEKGVERLIVGGLATDYCVKATVLDGIKKGFRVEVLEEGVRAVDLKFGDGEKAWIEMKAAGAVKFMDATWLGRRGI